MHKSKWIASSGNQVVLDRCQEILSAIDPLSSRAQGSSQTQPGRIVKVSGQAGSGLTSLAEQIYYSCDRLGLRSLYLPGPPLGLNINVLNHVVQRLGLPISNIVYRLEADSAVYQAAMILRHYNVIVIDEGHNYITTSYQTRRNHEELIKFALPPFGYTIFILGVGRLDRLAPDEGSKDVQLVDLMVKRMAHDAAYERFVSDAVKLYGLEKSHDAGAASMRSLYAESRGLVGMTIRKLFERRELHRQLA
ncbi:hypothetical protein BV326_01245 [Pseudomonas syringae pv. actinidiae]|uniref:ATP-binding protein n=1 Tax=Pseudomonas syringae TaxID=317 RepID=UPI000A25E880|nr:ATP-binding protein [Pseudomonas syringae]OSR74426.1 hypothetical protein BV326_01245 [Pseudomonas syringae pv. actinidiae]